MRYALLSTIPVTKPLAPRQGRTAIAVLRLAIFILLPSLAALTSGCAHNPVHSRIVPPPPITFSCVASPASTYPGDPVTITGNGFNFNPAIPLKYTWSSDSGVRVAGTSATANVETNGLTSGTYTVRGHASQGIKPGEFADCTTSFTVKAFDPPTLSCSANPSSLFPDETSTITASAHSPQNRPLTYSYSSTAGNVVGNTSNATLSTVGAPPGNITVTCNTLDDRGGSDSVTTTITVRLRPSPVTPPPQSGVLGVLSFQHNGTVPVRVGDETRQLHEIASVLSSSPGASLAIVGNAASDEKAPTQTLAAQRALGILNYFVAREGVDRSRLLAYTGSANAASAEFFLIPQGAAPNIQGVPLNGQALAVPPAPPTYSIAPTLPATSKPPACNAFAVFAYPSLIDLSDDGPDAMQVHLYVGSFNTLDQVFADLCGGNRIPDLQCAPTVISVAKSTACAGAPAFTLPSSYKGKFYTISLLPIHQDLPTATNADVDFPPGIDRTKWPDNPQNLQTTFGYWKWKTEVKRAPSDKLNEGTIDLAVSNANSHASLFDAPSKPFRVPLKWPTWTSILWAYLKSNLGKVIGALAGICTLLAGIIQAGSIRAYIGEKSQEESPNLFWVLLAKLVRAKATPVRPSQPAVDPPGSAPVQPPAAVRPVVVLLNQPPVADDVHDQIPTRSPQDPRRRRPRHGRDDSF